MKLFNVKFYKKNPKFKFISNFFLLLLIPIIICSFFSYIMNEHFVSSYKESLISSSATNMNNYLKTTEEKLYNLYTEANLIFDSSFIDNLSINDKQKSISSFNSNTQKYFVNNSILDSVIIVSISERTVITSQGYYDADDYFKNVFSYQDYDFDYICSKKPIANSRTLLAPTVVISPSKHTKFSVVPMLFSPVSANADKIVILNISSLKLFDDFSSIHFTDNNIHYMLKNNSDEFISTSNYPISLASQDTQYTQTGRYYFTDNITLNNQKYLLICSQSNFSLLGYTYAVAIPHSDISAQSRHLYTKPIIIMSVMIILLLIFAVLASAKFSTPWNKIATALNLSESEDLCANETITKITHSITDLVSDKNTLNSKLSTVLPLGQQRYITEILNSPNSHIEDDTYHIIFENDYFSAIAIKIFSRSDAIELTSQLNNQLNIAIESMFTEKFGVFRLPSVDNTLYLLLNVTEDCTNEEIDDIISQINELFKADEEILNIYIGKGSIQKDIDGLRLTHMQALNNLTDAINNDRIRINTSASLNDYSDFNNKETTLFNFLIANYTDKAIALVDSLFQVNKNKSVEYKQMIYTQIFNTITKVLKIKGITYPDFSDESADSFLKDLLTKSDDAILEYYTNLMNACNNKKMPSLKLDITAVIQYIQQNYTSDISLEHIAEFNHVSVPYLSKKLKQSLNMTFKEYLTQLRIDEAKKLLCENTDLSIQEVAESSGFYSNSAFTRSFKNTTGLSPREYRSLYKK